MSVRKIPKNYRNVTGIQAIDKSVGNAGFESTLERDFLTLLHFSQEVSSVEVQPLKLPTDPDDPSKSYTPDVLVKFDEHLGRKPWLCEVKYRKDFKKNWAKLKPKFLAAIRYCKAQGWRFRIVTEVEIRTQLLLNAKFLTGYLDRVPTLGREQKILTILDQQDMAVCELLLAISPDELVQLEWIPAIWHLVAAGRITTDLHSPLTMSSTLWVDHD
jgi:hypothetical protein